VVKNNKLTIMVVDDEPDIGDGICSIVELTGHKPVYFNSPVAAVKEIESNSKKYNAVFTDLRMPEMNGEEVIRRIRKVTKDTPIVIITGTRGIFATRDLVSLNIPSLIEKPFEMKDIELAVELIQEKYFAQE